MNATRRIEMLFEVIRTICALSIAYGVTLLVLILISKDPVEAVYLFAIGPFTSVRRFGTLMIRFIPLILTGLCMCFVYASNRFNLGGEGAYLFAGCIISWIAINTQSWNLPHVLQIAMLLIVGAIVGGAVCAVPALMREKMNANETVVSIMMNYALVYIGLYILERTMKDESVSYRASYPIPENSKLTQFVQGSQIHTGLFIAIAMIAVTAIVFYRTSLGYSIRISGSNPHFAKASGIKISGCVVLAQVIGGAMAGMGGAVDILGIYDRYFWQSLTNFGMDGLMVAVLAAKNPILIPVAAFLVAYMRTGAVILNYATDIPLEFVQVVQSIVILFVAATMFMGGLKKKMIYSTAHERIVKEVV